MIKALCRKSVYSLVFLSLMISACKNQQNKQVGNRLKNASSPYLKEHADNPVNWFEWGDEALAKAKKENKPLLISIGYASCHWCHVMERESFMDTSVARIMNESFVCIKVDREERPDIDNVYVHACQLLNNGDAGWPLNAFALPDGKPFFVGTYYTKDNWKLLLHQIADSYQHKNGKVVLQANAITFGIIDNDQLLFEKGKGGSQISKTLYRDLFEVVRTKIDFSNGGLRGKQKFPNPTLWEYLLQYNYLTGNQLALDAATTTLTKMALGGMYDHVGGGFARYSTDSLWRVPHFEKMLYDNGQLVSLYAHAYQVTKNELYRQTLEETIAFMERELSSPEGGFYSSLNAETEGKEGLYYGWSFDEFKNVVGFEKAALLSTYYHVQTEGNWENKQNILFASELPAAFAASNKLNVTEFNQLLYKTKNALLDARNKRSKPTVDTKILTSWNAIALRAYIDAYSATGNNSYLQRAVKIATFLEKNRLAEDGSLLRTYQEGKLSVNGFLDDYAWLSWAYIKLYQVTFNQHWLLQAKKIANDAVLKFYNSEQGMFYYTSANADKLVVRKMEVQDHVIPSSNAVMATVLYSLGTMFSDTSYTNKSIRMLTTVSAKYSTMPEYYAQWCQVLGIQSNGAYEVAILGTAAIQRNADLQMRYLPTCFFMGSTSEENLPLLKDKLDPKKTMIYICSNSVCKFPVETVDNALKQIK